MCGNQERRFKPLACGYHSHAEFSLDGGGTGKDKIKYAASIDRVADCLTDHGIMSGLASHWMAAENLKKSGVVKPDFKIIHGIEAYIIDPHRPWKPITKNSKKMIPQYYHLTIHFKDLDAYFYFCKLSKSAEERAVVKYGERKPLIEFKELEPISGHITIGSGCLIGPIQKNVLVGRYDLAEQMYKYLRDLAGKDNFYVEVFPHIITHNWQRPIYDKDTKRLITPGFFDPIVDIRDWEGDENSKPIPELQNPFYDDFECASAIDIQKIPNLFVMDLAEKYGDRAVISLDDHYGDPRDKIVQEARLGNGQENWKFFGSFEAQTSEEAAKRLKHQLDIPDSKIEELIDNQYHFIEHFDKYHFPTVKDQVLLPNTEMVYGVKYKGKTNKDIFWDLVNKHNMLPDKEKEPEKYQLYMDRVNYELSILVDNDAGVDFLPYFFLLEDVCEYARNNRITYTSRGCLSEDAMVLTVDNGYKKIKDVVVGDKVYSHTGNEQIVTQTMKYPSYSNLLSIKTLWNFDGFSMTNKHEVLAIKRRIKYERCYKSPSGKERKQRVYHKYSSDDKKWIKSKDLSVGDLIFTPWIKRKKIITFEKIDLAKYINTKDFDISGDTIYHKIPAINELSIRKIHRKTGLSRKLLQKIKRGDVNSCKQSYLDSLSGYLKNFNHTIQSWVSLDNTVTYSHNRYINADANFWYQVGKWIGDGWIIDKNKYFVGIAYHSENDIHELNGSINYFEKLGIKVSIRNSKNKKLSQLEIRSPLIVGLFRDLFPDYKNTSGSKYIGDWKYLSDEYIRSIALGLQSADGHIERDRECIDTTSKRLAYDIKELLMYLKIPSGVYTRDSHESNGYKCRESYKIMFNGLRNKPIDKKKYIKEDGYYSKVVDISETEPEYVYDISVKNDHSYITQNYLVHNSAGGSLSLYLLRIVITDPIKYNLSFERFLNPGRISGGSWPDVDLDWENRHLIIAYLKENYGDKFALIANDSKMRLKSSISDACRAIIGSVPPHVQAMTVSIPIPIGTSDDAKWLYGSGDDDPDAFWNSDDPAAHELKKFAQDNPEIWNMVNRCMGVTRQRGVHAGGVVITPGPVHEHIPVIKQSKGDDFVTAYDMVGVEYTGGIKYDMLGVKTLDAIGIAIRSIEEVEGVRLEWGEFPEDEVVYKGVVEKMKLAGVFQLNTNVAKPFVKRIKPKNIMEMAQLTALCRPGALDADAPDPTFKGNAAEYYVECAQGKRQPYIIHEDLRSIFSSTYGIGVFQEQLMKTGPLCAGYSEAETDIIIRKGIGKKVLSKIEQFRDDLYKNLPNRGWSNEQIEQFMSMVMASANYSFNASHSVSYAIVAWNCCWIKHYYPAHYWKGMLTVFGDQDDKLADMMHECEEWVRPVDILKSRSHEWSIEDGKYLRMPLDSIKGCGEKGVHKLRFFIGSSFEELADVKAKEKEEKDLRKKEKETESEGHSII